jgi:hypothetical protein
LYRRYCLLTRASPCAVTTGSLLRSVALRKVQSDMYIAPVTTTIDVIHNPPQPQDGSDYKDEKKLTWRRYLLRDRGLGLDSRQR